MISVVIASCINDNHKEKRLDCLDKCIDTYREIVERDYQLEIITIFDKSNKNFIPSKILSKIDKVYYHDRGLGASFNLGIKMAKYDIIVQTEDDWSFDDLYPELCYERFKTAINIVESYDKDAFVRMDANPEVDWRLGYLTIINDYEPFYLYNKPSEETDFFNVYDFYYYSNRPHIKRKSFHEKYNVPYKEDCSVPEVEIDMCYKFINNKNINVYSNGRTFDHIGNGVSVREQ